MPQTADVYEETLTFSVTDGIVTVAGTFTIHVTNNAPLANDGSASTLANQSLSSSVTASDVDADALTFQIESPPSHGAAILTPEEASSIFQTAATSGPIPSHFQ